jgi:hypothetical protein
MLKNSKYIINVKCCREDNNEISRSARVKKSSDKDPHFLDIQTTKPS